MFRDLGSGSPAHPVIDRSGRRAVAVIGIDRYLAWPQLSNAVSDARGALRAFVRLGFEPVVELYDEVATCSAIRRLVTEDLARLGEHDSLVLFFAGHGHTVTQKFADGDTRKTGYLLPSDGQDRDGSTAHWLRLDHWLSDIALLKARHILVILDACYTGIALGSLVKWRGSGRRSASFAYLAQRRSRRVITSALDDQRAMDCGPRSGHSLFTGCLIEALDGDLAPPGTLFTGSELALYLQNRVTSYPQSEQTPDFGALEEDKRGELILEIPAQPADPASSPAEAHDASHEAPTLAGPGGHMRARPGPGRAPAATRTRTRRGRGDEGRADVGVLVALTEEFEQMLEIVGQARSIPDDHGGYYFGFDLPAPGGDYRCVARVVGEAGISAARGVAERLLDRWTPAVAVALGIAAALDDDVQLGDLVVATQIDAYDASLRAVANGRGGFTFQHRGMVYRGDPHMLAAIRDLGFAHRAAFDELQAVCGGDAVLSPTARLELQAAELLSPLPAIHRGHIASGSILGAASEFKRRLRLRDDSLKALEMEGAALAAAAWDRQPQTPALVIRGISDFADRRKRRLDAIGGGRIRRYAMRNAVRFLALLARVGFLPRHPGGTSALVQAGVDRAVAASYPGARRA